MVWDIGRYGMTIEGLSYRRTITLGLLLCVVCGGYTAGFADDADDLIAEVLAKSGKGAKSADRLIKIAEGLDSPKDRIRLCEKAYECGISESAGYSSALAALDMLVKCDPARTDACGKKRLDVYRLLYVRSARGEKLENGRTYVKMLLAQADKCGKAGDWSGASKYCTLANSAAWALKLPERKSITDRLRDARNRIMIASRLASLKKSVAKDPADLESRKRLVETYLIDMDQPAEAAKHLDDKLDETLRANVALAARETSELPEADLMTLGQWYRKLVLKTVSKTTKSALLIRARDNLARYLELHTAADVARARAGAALKSVEAGLEKLNAAAPIGRISTTGLRTRTITLNLGKGVTMKLVRIPPGKFVMGSPKTEKDRRKDEGPLQEITITKPYYMGVTEVTQRQYLAVTGENPAKSKGLDNPVVQVSFEKCQAFCKAMSKLTRRRVCMPDDALWEYACRAGTRSRFSFKGDDDDLDAYAWFRDNSDRKTHPVAQKKPNAWGLYDMHGNVWEHCAAWTTASSGAPTSIDPAVTNTVERIVVRGGSMNEPAGICRSACTYRQSGSNHVGFRVIITLN